MVDYNKIKNINDINYNTIEGVLLVSALAMLSTETHTNKTPDDVLEMVVNLSRQIENTNFKHKYKNIPQ